MNKVKLKFPSRISMNLFSYPDGLVKGGYGVAIKMDNYLSIERSKDDVISIKSIEKNVDLLVEFFLNEFRKLTNTDFKVKIYLELDNRFRNHCGLAFNSNIQCALYYALNQLLDNRYTKDELLEMLFKTYAELDNEKISKNDSTCMISQNCAFNGGLNIIDDLNLIYNYKLPNNYKVILIHFNNKLINNNIKEIKKEKNIFKPINIVIIRDILNNKIIPDLKNNNIISLKANNLELLKGSTRIIRLNNYLDNKKIISTINDLSLFGIVGLTSTSPTVYYIGENLNIFNKYKNIDIYEIDNNGIEIIKE